MSEPIVKAIEHVAIAVRDADGAKQTFAALGFEPQWVEDLPSQGLRSHVLRAEGVLLELIEPAAKASAAGPLDRFLAHRGEGVHHVCLRVGSLEEAARAVQAAGMRLVDQAPTVDQQGRRVFVHPGSAHGVLIGLVEPHQAMTGSPDHPGGQRVSGAPDRGCAGQTYVIAVARAGTPLFISGLNAAQPDGTVRGDDMASQARASVGQLALILAEAGAGLANVVKITDYIVSREEYCAVADVRREFFGESLPASTGIVVKELPGGVLIEMDAVAML